MAIAIFSNSPVAQNRLAIRKIEIRAEENDFADRIGEDALFQSQARSHRLPGSFLIGRQKHLEGSVLGYLREQLPGRSKTQNRPAAGRILEKLRDLLRRFGEIRRHGDTDRLVLPAPGIDPKHGASSAAISSDAAVQGTDAA